MMSKQILYISENMFSEQHLIEKLAVLLDAKLTVDSSTFETLQNNFTKGNLVSAPLLILFEADDYRLGSALMVQKIKKLYFKTTRIYSILSPEDISYSHELFDAGSDDVIFRPINDFEFLARISRFLVNINPKSSNLIGELQINSHNFTIQRKNSCAILTPKEFTLFQTLLNADEHRCTKEHLMVTPWEGVNVDNKTLHVHLSNLRKKLNIIGLELRFSIPNIYQLIIIKN